MNNCSIPFQEKKQSPAERRKQAMLAERDAKRYATITTYPRRVHIHNGCETKLIGGGKRGKCTPSSKEALRHLELCFADLDMSDMYELFVTMTLPAIYTDERLKQALDAFQKRLKGNYKSSDSFIWTRELQERGALHYHLYLLMREAVCTCGGGERETIIDEYTGEVTYKYPHENDCGIHQFEKELKLLWADISKRSYKRAGGDMEAYGIHNERHRSQGVNVEVIRDRDDREFVMRYMTKRPDKNDQSETSGRIWGKRNLNGKLYFSQGRKRKITYHQMVVLRRWTKKWLISQGDREYAESLDTRPIYSVLGLGTDSRDGSLIERMLNAIPIS